MCAILEWRHRRSIRWHGVLPEETEKETKKGMKKDQLPILSSSTEQREPLEAFHVFHDHLRHHRQQREGSFVPSSGLDLDLSCFQMAPYSQQEVEKMREEAEKQSWKKLCFLRQDLPSVICWLMQAAVWVLDSEMRVEEKG